MERQEPGGGRRFSYRDYLSLPEEPGYRFEVLSGSLIREPSPGVPHQRTSRRIGRALEDYSSEVDAGGEVFNAPLDVTLGDTTVAQPDVPCASGDQRHMVGEDRIDGPPTLVVEIASASTGRRDRIQKLRIHREAGVECYWIASPRDRTLECFALSDGAYALVVAGVDEDTLVHPAFGGLSVSLGALWSTP